MAPVKKPQPSTKPRKSTTRTSTSSSSKTKSKSKISRPPPKQVKTKPTTATTNSTTTKRKKTPTYTEKQLSLPTLNSIVPASAVTRSGRGTGKKRNKVYVDDAESMMTILAIVNAEKEGQIESKVAKARQLEEIRQAREREAEKRAEGRKGRLDGVIQDLRKKEKNNKSKRSGKGDGDGEENGKMAKVEGKGNEGAAEQSGKKKRKSVSFA